MSKGSEAVSFRRVVMENFAVAVVLFISVVGMQAVLASEYTVISPVWPLPGIALAVALLFGWRVALGIFLPLAVGSFSGGNPGIFSVLAPLGMVIGVYFGRALLLWKKFDVGLVGARDVLLLAGLGAGLPMGVVAFGTAVSLLASGQIEWNMVPAVGAIYWVANAAGTLVVAPVLLMAVAGKFSPRRMGLGWAAGGLGRLAFVFLASWFAFFGSTDGGVSAQALAYLPFPFLVWMALSRGLAGAALSVMCVVGMAVVATSRGMGPFAGEDAMQAFWQIEVFLTIVTTSGLLIGAGSDAQRREKALQAETATRKAELERLKAQVNPHFLFNCLTAIQSLVRTDSGAAEAGLGALSSLLRKSLDVAKHPLIPLGEELEIIRDALRLQKMRFEEGLEWSVSADKQAHEFLVPPMLLQPLVENAVKHGVCDGFGRVDLNATVDGGVLTVSVRNTAPPDCDPAAWPQNVGLAGVRARIAETCGAGSSVEFSKIPDGWIQALVRIQAVVGGR